MCGCKGGNGSNDKNKNSNGKVVTPINKGVDQKNEDKPIKIVKSIGLYKK